ncbi:phage tail protein [Providencia alcalifaciens]|uniref:phage tail-collar fiber domain-containing protein n=1 Tax=Providencia alcalifaciens TaxID=126385 RepID=UPI000451B8B3|nr:phage tail protein [Providencia alcalifaciens]EUC94042.1 tail fiber protein [Providencia alcalifaciens PAL-2]MTC39998.1 phage tail protein [Providencia alcalifaciens]
MASVITTAFENWKAQEAANGNAVLLDEFVFANVPNLDPTQPIDRNETLPPTNQIVHRQAVNKAGLASENAVAYSVTLGADVGNFDFNWIGLMNKESGTVAMITHAPTQKKLKTQNGQQGNVLTRSFLLEFQGAAAETQIQTTAETWQIDFTARLSGIDEMQRLINLDNYGAAAFFDDGFEVTRNGEQYTIKKGLGYVGGLRGQLEKNQILNGLRNTKIYADFSYQGNISSQWNTVIKITETATLSNYVDVAGFTHQVFAIASIDASGNVKDLRPQGALSSQEISALEARFKLDLSKKIDKANITNQTGNSSELVASQGMVTSELGKKQPVGDYATNNALNEKFNTANNNANSRVPNTRRVNNKPLSTDITLTAGDVGAYTKAEVDSRSVNLDAIYPIGIVAWFAQNKNPNTLFPNTKWQYLGENKTIRLANSNGSNVLTTGGADSIQLTEAQLPAHNHSFSATTSSFDYGTKSTNTTGAHTHGVNGEDSGSGGSNFGRGNGNTRTINGMHSAGNHAHTVAIGAHSHTVSGTTESKGSSSAINVTNAYIMLMGWYRVS